MLDKRVRLGKQMGIIRIVRRVMSRAHWVLFLIVIDHLLAGIMFSIMEDAKFGEGQWWATVTGFTVGYGDFYPKSLAMRGIAQFYIISMAVLWLVLGAHIVATLIEDKNLFSHEEQERLEACLLEMAKEMTIVPQDAVQMPSTAWFTEHKGFIQDRE